MLEKGTFAEFRRNVSTYSNHAIFEVPLILDQLIAEKSIDATAVSTLVSVDPFASVAWAGLT
jgi:hypothetical protein